MKTYSYYSQIEHYQTPIWLNGISRYVSPVENEQDDTTRTREKLVTSKQPIQKREHVVNVETNEQIRNAFE